MAKIRYFVSVIRAMLLASLASTPIHSPNPALAQDADEIDWITARAQGTPEAFERYLEIHPLGRYASEAFYFVTILSIDPSVERIDPTQAPSEAVTRGITASAMDVY